jgi:hypothetical protein
MPAIFVTKLLPAQVFSLTSRFSGVAGRTREDNRFSGFRRIVETAEAVLACCCGEITPLKRGVNERKALRVPALMKRSKSFSTH